MKWEKQGRIFQPDGQLQWAQSGAQLPTAAVFGDIIRVYFACKDADGFGRTGYVDLDADDPQRVLYVAPEPVLDIGELGTFDDCGVVPNSIIEIGNRTHLYYQGFQRTERVPYLTFTGLAIGDANGRNMVKYSRAPITDRTNEEPFIRSTSCIINENNLLKMWYVSTIKWTHDEHGVHYICVIRYATSSDGIDWRTHSHICLEPNSRDEYAVGRPSVVCENGLYKMWYSIRSFTALYAIGYAESEDGIVWQRKDHEAGIEKSNGGWDSEMICYPFVLTTKNRKLMFYNGNGRGLTGFGYAVLDSSM